MSRGIIYYTVKQFATGPCDCSALSLECKHFNWSAYDLPDCPFCLEMYLPHFVF